MRRFYQAPRRYDKERGDKIVTCRDCDVPSMRGAPPFVRVAGVAAVYVHAGNCPTKSVAKKVREALGLDRIRKARRLLKTKVKIEGGPAKL